MRRADRGRCRAAEYVDGATCSSRQIGSTPKRSRWVSMKRVLSAVAGRAPVRKNPRPPSESRWRGATRDSRARAAAAAPVPRSSAPLVHLHQPQHAAPTSVTSRRSSRTSRRSRESLPTATHARLDARTPSARPARGSLLGTCLVVSSPHPLRSWSLQHSRGGSQRDQRTLSQAGDAVCSTMDAARGAAPDLHPALAVPDPGDADGVGPHPAPLNRHVPSVPLP